MVMNAPIAPFPRISRFRTAVELRHHLAGLKAEFPLDDNALAAEHSPLAWPISIGGFAVGNRWCIHPMEGWDATAAGQPTETVLRRWRRFGESGAKLIWGGEAVAVVAEGRANPNQLLASSCGQEGFSRLLTAVQQSHHHRYGTTADLLVALQLTDSGRFSRPTGAGRYPRIAYHHPVLDGRHNIAANDTACVITDAEIEQLIVAYVEAAKNAAAVGFQMVDIKACHGYLLHEFLSARRRPGRYGGDFENRSRLLLTIISRIREACPSLLLGVRLSLFDTVPWHNLDGQATPWPYNTAEPYDCGFGVDERDPHKIDLTEPVKLLRALHQRGVATVNLTAGSPYTVPHIQRPAAFPPIDGYPPPEDPLIGVWRQLAAAHQAKQAVPELVLVGSGYSYLQEFVPHAAQALIRDGWIDLVGLGRMVLSYPELPADVLAGRQLQRKLVCRTFSDCTTAPRQGLRSGCYPLDAYYKSLEPDAAILKTRKHQ
jgi:NADPH2 dehydrogenase